MGESKDFGAFVHDPSVPRNTKLDGLNAVLTKMGATEITKNFIGAPKSRGAAQAGRARLRGQAFARLLVPSGQQPAAAGGWASG